MKNIIVSGGSNGIGQSVVKTLVQRGHQVVFGDIDVQGGHATQEELGHDKCRFMELDVTEKAAWSKLVEGALEFFGPSSSSIDALVNSAGTVGPLVQDPATVDHEEFMKCLEVNVGGSQLGISAVMPHLKDRGGTIINMSSNASTATTANAALFATYACSKTAVDMLTRGVASQYGASSGVSCYSINPTFFDTTLARRCLEFPAVKGFGWNTFEDLSFFFNPLGNVGTVDTLAPLVVNAIEGNCAYPNGASIGAFPSFDSDTVVTYDLTQLMGQLVDPSPWGYEPMVANPNFSFRDETGQELQDQDREELLLALKKTRSACLEAMGVITTPE